MNDIWKELLHNSSKIELNFNEINIDTIQACIPLPNYTLIKIAGPDAEKFLQGQTTNDVTLLQDGNWQLTCCCNQKGRIIAVVWLSKHQSDYFGIVESSTIPLLLIELKKFAVFSKVTIVVDEAWVVLGAVGEALSILKQHAIAQLTYTTALPQGFLLYTAENLTKIPSDLPLAPASLWQYLNMKYGIAEVFKTTQEQFTPAQLNLPALNAVNYKKGCYRGQEIIARMHYLGKLKQSCYLVKIETAATFAIGTGLFDAADNSIGELVNIIPLDEKHYLGLAVLNNANIDGMIQLKQGQLEVLR